MTKLISWLQTDISLLKKEKSKRLRLKDQRKVIQLFANLMSAGFNLTEMVSFLERSQLLPTKQTKQMRQSLLNGRGMADMLVELGFSDEVVTQLSLAEIHGNTLTSLQKIDSYLANLTQVKKKLIEVATYPVILLSFLVLIMLGLKNYLLPQLENGNWATTLISNFPVIFLGTFLAVLIFIFVTLFIAKRQSRLKVWSFLSRFPFLGKAVQLYLTAYYAREWGNLIGQGVELAQITQLMQEQKSLLFQEIGKDMEEALLSGRDFHQKVLDYPFFLRELSLIIEYGEVKSKLGSELDIFAEETWTTFFYKLTKSTQIIQPIIFIFVALMIVMIYAAMLLPMYENMGGYF
ncbi:competence type IV pilus assembly protein ComGB [Streptococcus sp. S784/96/1]|uniref:competence type IV pilus assembly protein ComGB n=1 Tax=Streptococcus sp. S784/96/1 TaxID=2653499 RepID=UPI001386F326|nr:competence type IV pilus assembly protein ComGB [Streptococcus sp. S784/96/1]